MESTLRPSTLRCTPVHRSLLEMKTIAGVEDRLAILNATLALAVAMGAGLWYWLLAAFALHVVAARLGRHDPWVRQVYTGYALQSDAYDPWPRLAMRRSRRPDGFGRGLLC
ncbi:MAG: VirB3 family type IV secretion system protein [Burkholderiales bacterium]|jgi:type IV secretion system protein TrbD|nr:VirB3 family type IV secretion system protein [Burkholderiales bacterium]